MRYFFRGQDGKCFPDDVGVELSSLRRAAVEAVRSLGEYLKDNPEMFWEHNCFEVTTSDENRLDLFTLTVVLHKSAAIAGRDPGSVG